MRTLAIPRRLGLLVLLAASCTTAPAFAQSLSLPTTAPEYIEAGRSVIVRPVVRDALGRPTSAVRVQAWSSDTTVLRVSYVSGGQRLTAVAAGTAHVTWRWQRTDGTSRTIARTVRVTAAISNLPATPPADTSPPTSDTLATVTAVQTDPLGEFTLAVGDTMVLRIVSATVGKGTSARAATEPELQSTDFKWGTSGYVSIRPAPDGRSTLVYNARAGQRGRIDIKRGNSLLGQRWVQGSIAADTTPSPPSVAVVGTRYVGMSPPSTACARPLIAGEQMGVRGDTALFVRALEGLPAWVYCVADSLAVTLEGDLVTPDTSAAGPPTLLTYARGAALPVVWPATGQGDTTVRIDSLRITGGGGGGGGIGTGTVLGLLGAGAVVSLLAGANALARRGKAEDV